MLLPSGRSNSEQYSHQNSNKNSLISTANSTRIPFDNLNENEEAVLKVENLNLLSKEQTKFPNNTGNELNLHQISQNVTKNLLKINENVACDSEKTLSALLKFDTTNNDKVEEIEKQLNLIQNKLEDDWTVHLRNDGRLFYCNHKTRSASWIPSIKDWIKFEDLPYGWERAIDSKGRFYYINHQNKTTTYEEPESIKSDDNPPQPRIVVLERSSSLGFGFVAGSEKPVLVRFITEGGPSINKLLPGDQILAVNGEDVKEAPRDHVIQLIRACETQATLLVCQPMRTCTYGRKSTLLSAGKRAKLRNRPNRVRFAESVCVNGAPLFPASAFSLSDICVPPMANVLKVFLENGQTKSFKYDTTTTVQDVTLSLLDKLCLKTSEIFSLVLEHVKSLKRNKFSLLDPEETLAKIAARPGAHKLRCLFRVTFVPSSPAQLAQKDINALDYLFMQCCNDVTQERFAPELQPEVALRLATLQIYQHALDNNFCIAKLNMKIVEREFGLEKFLPPSLMEGMKRKELRRLLTHFYIEMTGSLQKNLSQLQAKLNYLEIISTLPSYGAKCFSTNQRIGIERVILVGPRFGLSQITNSRNSVPQAITAIEDISHIIINNEDDINYSVSIFISRDKVFKFSMEDRDANELSLVLAGYYRLFTGNILTVIREKRQDTDDDNAPLFLSQHSVLPAYWSYLELYHQRIHSINFFASPPYHYIEIIRPINSTKNITDCEPSHYSILQNGKRIDTTSMELDIHSVIATELLEEAKDSCLNENDGPESHSNHCKETILIDKDAEVLQRVHEMQKMVENSEKYLNEQNEIMQEISTLTENRNQYSPNKTSKINTSNWNDIDSDSESLSSSKLSFRDENYQQIALNHSDSLVLLAETINKDLCGISHNLNSINENKAETKSFLAVQRQENNDETLSQLLNNIQLNIESESDAESILSPMNSPTSKRSIFPKQNLDKYKRNKETEFRGSFGLHSPDEVYFHTNNKDSSLQEYLKNLTDESNFNASKLLDETKRSLSQIYSKAVLENDADLIDLRAIPPPQTPDDLDGFSLVNVPPVGFDDSLEKSLKSSGEALDEFLEKVIVSPPTQKITPSKELTPEEIMSFIIPPPPILDVEKESTFGVITNDDNCGEIMESFYSNSDSINRNSTYSCRDDKNIIEYSSVESNGTFSCCPKTKKVETYSEYSVEQNYDKETFKVPPRLKPKDFLPPERPPKSIELVKKLSPKKHLIIPEAFENQYREVLQLRSCNKEPPKIPPRNSPQQINTNLLTSNFSTGKFKTETSFSNCSSSPEAPKPMYNIYPVRYNQNQNYKQESPTISIPKKNICLSEIENPTSSKGTRVFGEKIIIKNGHVIDAEALLSKTEVAMAGLLLKLDQIANQCSAAQSAGGGSNINEVKFEESRTELTEQTLALVTASKFLVIAMSDITLQTFPEHLTSCLTALRRITELTLDMAIHTSAPLQTRNIVLKVHDVAANFRELVQVDIGPQGAGQLALQAECLANVLAALLRSLRVFSP